MIKAGAGATVHTDLTTANVGNVPVNVQANHTFCIFDGTGIDRAFFTSLTEDRSDGKKRVDRLLDGLAGAHGGLVRLQVEKGSGDIAPGDIRELHVVLRFPHELHPGQSYSGVWSISTSNYYVQIEVTETASGEEVR